MAADAVRYGLVRLQLLQEGSELRRGKGDCFRPPLAHPAFRGIFDKLAVRQLHALGQNARSFAEQGEGNALLLPTCVFGQTHAAEMQAFAAHECLVSCRSNACSCMVRMRGFVWKGTDRQEVASLSQNRLRCSFVFAMLTDYGMMRGKEQVESDKRKFMENFYLLIVIALWLIRR